MTSRLFQVTWRLDGREDSPRETYVFGEDMLGALAFFQRVFRDEQPLAVKEVTVLFSLPPEIEAAPPLPVKEDDTPF